MRDLPVDPLLEAITLCMARYVAEIFVRSALQASMDRLGLRRPVTPRDAEALVADAVIGLRLFCDESRLHDFMEDLSVLSEAILAQRRG